MENADDQAAGASAAAVENPRLEDYRVAIGRNADPAPASQPVFGVARAMKS